MNRIKDHSRKDARLQSGLRQTYRRLINQLDQKVGREKTILRKYTRQLDRLIRKKASR